MSAKILVVDDEPHLEMVIRQVFRKQSRRGELVFLFAENGERALELLAEHPDVDVVLSDIKMPRISGLGLLKRLNEEHPLIRTVMLTAYGDMKHIRSAMNHGAFDFLTKPINLDDLQITLGKTLEQVELMKGLHRERQMRHLAEKLGRLNESLTATLNLDEILDRTLANLKEMVGYERALIALAGTEGLTIEVAQAWDQADDHGFNLFLEGLFARVGDSNQHLCLSDTSVTGTERASELLCLPLPMGQGRGGMVLLERAAGSVFGETDCSMARAVTRQAAFAVDNARLYEQVARLAVKDPITGLHNRRYFLEQAAREVRRAKRHKHPLSLLLLDLEWFRQAVANGGKASAETLLALYASALWQVCRQTDLVARYGEDRLAILLIETKVGPAAKMAQRLQTSIAEALTDHPNLAACGPPGLATLTKEADLNSLIASAERSLSPADQESP